MKKIMGLLFLVTSLGFVGIHAKCIKTEHVSSHPIPNTSFSTTQYQCNVKASETANFQTPTGGCVFCGCASRFHDELTSTGVPTGMPVTAPTTASIGAPTTATALGK